MMQNSKENIGRNGPYARKYDREVIKALYVEYLENPGTKNIQEARLSGLNAAMDDLVEHKRVTHEAIADFEEAARCAGFYAGFKAGAEMLNRE